MTSEPLVSVVIPVYNRTDTVKDAIESVCAQTYRNREIIVVDDGSAPAVERALTPYFPLITYIRHHTNRGVSAARNTALRIASGDYIALLDSDDIWLPEKLTRQVAAMQASGRQVSHTGEFWYRMGKWINQGKKYARYGGDCFAENLDMCRMSPSSLMVHRDVLKTAGTFNERLRVCEDYDLNLRLTALYPVEYIDIPLIIKRAVTDDQLSASILNIESIRLNILCSFLSCFPHLPREKKISAINEIKRKYLIVQRGIL